jgi:hypothetical protein
VEDTAMITIGAFKLRNNGGFVCAGKVQYINDAGGITLSDRWDRIPIGQDEMMFPRDRDVADGSIMQMYIDIVWGDDRTGGTYFLYDSNSKKYAEYDITGTTLNSTVHFDGIKTLPPD